ncbi:MAG: type II toxin-antitoxin system Phd/YefM family antitoxin [Actinomycetota bacterium]
MAVTKPVHEVKDQLSRVIAEVEETGEEVHITRHGRVVAHLVPPPSSGVVLGVGERTGVSAPDLDELRWSADELDGIVDGAVEPS